VGKGIQRANAASVEEGRRHERLDFLVALEVGSMLRTTAAVTGKAWWRWQLGMARGGRQAGEWTRWALSPSGPDTLVGQRGNERRRSRPTALVGWAREEFSKEKRRGARWFGPKMKKEEIGCEIFFPNLIKGF
jgi:hypothetical protein